MEAAVLFETIWNCRGPCIPYPAWVKRSYPVDRSFPTRDELLARLDETFGTGEVRKAKPGFLKSMGETLAELAANRPEVYGMRGRGLRR